jgi:hypothetical protein
MVGRDIDAVKIFLTRITLRQQSNEIDLLRHHIRKQNKRAATNRENTSSLQIFLP